MRSKVIRSLGGKQPTLEQAVHMAGRRLAAAHVDEETAASVSLAILEALGNIARHACRPSESLKFDLLLDIGHDLITVDVADYGPGFELHNYAMPDIFAESGRGIPLMRQLCDSLEYRRGPARNHLILRKRYAPGIRKAS